MHVLICTYQYTLSFLQGASPDGFAIGMKLEAVDKKNSILTCVATVIDILGDMVLVHFDGWEDSYDYWCDPTSPYIHPVGWCQETGKPISPPNGMYQLYVPYVCMVKVISKQYYHQFVAHV